MIENDIEINDIEEENGNIILYADPQNLFKIKDAISKKLPNVEFDMDEITMLPKEKVELVGEDVELFKKILTMLDDIEDVQNVYHNVDFKE